MDRCVIVGVVLAGLAVACGSSSGGGGKAATDAGSSSSSGSGSGGSSGGSGSSGGVSGSSSGGSSSGASSSSGGTSSGASSSGGSGSSSGFLTDAGCTPYPNQAPPITETDDTSQQIQLPNQSGGTASLGTYNLTSEQFFQGSSGYSATAMVQEQLVLQSSTLFTLVDGSTSLSGSYTDDAGQFVLDTSCPSGSPTLGPYTYTFAQNVLTFYDQTNQIVMVFTLSSGL